MVWYVALVAILNLALGYYLAIYLGAGRKDCPKLPSEQSVPIDRLAEEGILQTADSGNVFEEMSTADGAPPPSEFEGDLDSVTGFATRTEVERRLADMILAHADLQPMTVALIEVDQAEDIATALDDRVLRGLAVSVREMLTEAHTAARYSDQQFLLLLSNDDVQSATRRMEQIRQRVAANQYSMDGQTATVTLTCSLAQVAAEHTVSSLFELLEEALDEAKRYGGNRTFMHDGISPAPVVPPELNFATQTCAI